MQVKRVMCVIVAMVMALTLLPGRVSAAGIPTPAPGNYENWIDRIAELPDYAASFYTWLEDNAGPGGALVDPTKATAIGDSYVQLVHTIKGTAQFQYTTGTDVKDQAMNAALNHAGNAPQEVMAYIFDVLGAFDRDHPEVFWLNAETICGLGINYEYSTAGTVRTVDYELSVYFYLSSSTYDVRMEEYRTPEALSAAMEQRDQDVQRILVDCPTDDPFGQIHYLNQVLTHTNAYNSVVGGVEEGEADRNAWKCVSALSGSSGAQGPVCEGYARAFKVLCDELGIPCVLTSGTARLNAEDTPESHMWNYVELDGQWYAVDVTWNDPMIKSNPKAVISGHESESWMLMGSETETLKGLKFSETHTVENCIQSGGQCYVNGPALAEQAYSVADGRMDISPYRSGDAYSAPVKEGYVFAGWFRDAALTQPLDKNVKTGYAYPKFVHAGTLSVRYQTKSDTAGKTDLRLLTSVDCLLYNNVVFEVIIQGQTAQLPCTTVYDKINAGGIKIDNASAVFGPDSRYFVTHTLLNIPQAICDVDITVVPRWQTMDGTVVCGTERTICIGN